MIPLMNTVSEPVTEGVDTRAAGGAARVGRGAARRRVWWVFGGIVAIAIAWAPLLSPRTSVLWGRDVRILARLKSDSPQERKLAAWKAIESDDPELLGIVRAGAQGGETDDDVREAYIYALGKREDAGYFDAIEHAVRNDESGYVRSAAWLAAARADPQRVPALAADASLPNTDWDRLGQAQGLLGAGDMSRVGELLDWAERGNRSQRVVAGRALHKWLRPLMDAVGRWPLDAIVAEGDVWPAEFVDEIRGRCAGLDLQSILQEMRPHLAGAEEFRSQLRRVTSARDRIGALLFDD